MYGVYILTARTGEKYCASTVTWVSQASFNPPLLMVCIRKKSTSFEVVNTSRSFVLHCLDITQISFISDFFRSTLHQGDTLNGHPNSTEESVLPTLTECPAYLICEVREILYYGDHPVFVAEITDARVRWEYLPLELKSIGWSYGG